MSSTNSAVYNGLFDSPVFHYLEEEIMDLLSAEGSSEEKSIGVPYTRRILFSCPKCSTRETYDIRPLADVKRSCIQCGIPMVAVSVQVGNLQPPSA